MSISGSLSNALSGLTAAARAAELISSNVANANTEGYGVRSLNLSSSVVSGSGGVHIDGVSRGVNDILIGDRRLADAALGHDQTMAGFLAGLERIVGTPDDNWSLSGRYTAFEAALIEASANPASEARLIAVQQSAADLVAQIRSVSDGIQAARMQADSSIAQDVAALNDGLARIEQLNYAIQEARASGQDPSALMDQRQQTIDGIAEIVPIRQVERENGLVALFTPGGAMLLDGRPAEFGFTATGVITHDMTLGAPLAGLTLNGQPVAMTGGHGLMSGGTLAAHFAIRDDVAPGMQSGLDALARDLVERFQDASLDSTRGPGDPGLFTDAGAAFNAIDEPGLSSRLALNNVVDPAQGGAVWRLRDGLGATAPGDAGNAALLSAMTTALTQSNVPASGGFSGAAHSGAGLAAEFLSSIGAERRAAESAQSYSATQADRLKQAEFAGGVDTDAELQKLMQIEQAYAANAKVMTVADDLLQTILQL